MDAGPDLDIINRLPWPLITLDFEASALDARSYPIEVGICRWQAPDAPLEGWSTLITPTEHWATHGLWSRASELVHGIAQEELYEGLSPTETIERLNQIAGAGACYCDGGTYDLDWARKLNAASEIKATFKLGDWDMLTAHLAPNEYMQAIHWMDQTSIPHRAGPDAQRLMKALARALGVADGDVVPIAPC